VSAQIHCIYFEACTSISYGELQIVDIDVNWVFVFCQWDARTGGVVQEYNYHLQPANSITFYDEGRRFITTSDDKKVLVSWGS
jgi:hypothetical protein